MLWKADVGSLAYVRGAWRVCRAGCVADFRLEKRQTKNGALTILPVGVQFDAADPRDG